MHELTNFNPLRLLFYFTTWNCILVCFFNIFDPYIDIVFTSFTVLIISSYFVYVRPRYIKVTSSDMNNDVIQGIQLQVLHGIFHILPFALVVLWLKPCYKVSYKKLFFTAVIVYVYMLTVNVEKLYNITRQEMVLLSILAVIVLQW